MRKTSEFSFLLLFIRESRLSPGKARKSLAQTEITFVKKGMEEEGEGEEGSRGGGKR